MDRRGELRRRPAAARRVRPRDRGDRRADGLEARPVREDRAAHRAACDRRVEHVGAVARRAVAKRCRKRCGKRFCGVHFFNPPRYMHLVELIAGARRPNARAARRARGVPDDDARQGRRSARRTRRTSSPTAIGMFSMLATMAHTAKSGLASTTSTRSPARRSAARRARRTAPRTSSGLDTLAHVIKTMRDTLPDDPWHALFATPPVLDALVAKGALGQKTKAGFFRKVGKDIQVLDPATADVPRRGRCRRAGGGGILQDSRAGRALREAARVAASAGAVPVGDLPRPLPLQRVPAGGDRRQRARRRPRDALGLRLADGAVRDVAGGGMEATSRRGSPRTSPPARRSPRRRCPHGSAATRSRRRVAFTRRQAPIRRRREMFVPACAAGVRAAALSRSGAGRALSAAARRSSKPTPCGCGILARTSDLSFRTSSTRSARRCSTACSARSTRPRSDAPAW